MIALVFSVLALIPLGSIPLQLHLDTRRAWAAEMETWHGANVEALPAPRVDLAYPLPVSPMDLPARWDTQALASVELVNSRARHRIGEAPGTAAQRARWNTPTGQFWLIVEQLGDLEEPCSHCAAPEDGERPHAGCPGCACPCSTAPPLPAGVEGHLIGGRTR
jgi:hypothetical protein